MLTSKAAILQCSNQELLIAEINVPEILLDRQVLVKISYSSICGSQIGEIQAIKGPDRYLPHLLGHEGVGTVIKVGPEVSRIKIGDRVVMHWMKNNEPDATNPKYTLGDISINAGPIATFSEYAIISENRLTCVEIDIDDSKLAFLGCGALTAYGVLVNDLKATLEDSLLIIGAGGIGAITLLMAQSLGFTKVNITDQNLDKIKFIEKISNSISLTFSKFNEGSNKYTNIIDTTGNTSIIEKSYEALNKKGTLCLVGVTPVGETIRIDPMPLHYGKAIVGSFGGSVYPFEDIHEITNMIMTNRFDPLLLSSTTISLNQINESINLMQMGKISGKILIKIKQSNN
jgi:D-arabinose 1-dehydrogenase-like Zn-dependent alcohol dehydrogenase